MANAERLEISRDGYYTHPAISNSMISDYLESPRLYQKRYVLKTMGKRRETPQMRMGTLRHCRVLEPKRWQKFAVVAPSVDRRTKAGKEKFAEFEASLGPDSIIVTQEEYDLCEETYEEILQHSLARKYLIDDLGESELPIAWDCTSTELRLKALLDRLLAGGTIVDAKFTAQPKKEFWKSYTAKDRGYQRQAAHYLDGVSALTGVDANCLNFVFVMVQSEQPYDIYAHKLQPEFLAAAWEELHFAKKRLAKSLKTGDWYPPGSLSVQEIPQPLWNFDVQTSLAEAE